VSRQRPLLRVASELALVGVLSDAPGRTGGEWIMRVIKELVRLYYLSCPSLLNQHLKLSHDPSLASLPLLTSFLKSFAAPYLGINASESIQDVLLIEREISDRFKKMCEGYFEKISKKLVNDFAVRRFLP
jgi:regulator of nonsense transcripts 2